MLLLLPTELLLGVVGYLGAVDVARMAATCRALHSVCSDDAVWRELCVRSLGLELPDGFAAAVEARGLRTMAQLTGMCGPAGAARPAAGPPPHRLFYAHVAAPRLAALLGLYHSDFGFFRGSLVRVRLHAPRGSIVCERVVPSSTLDPADAVAPFSAGTAYTIERLCLRVDTPPLFEIVFEAVFLTDGDGEHRVVAWTHAIQCRGKRPPTHPLADDHPVDENQDETDPTHVVALDTGLAVADILDDNDRSDAIQRVSVSRIDPVTGLWPYPRVNFPREETNDEFGEGEEEEEEEEEPEVDVATPDAMETPPETPATPPSPPPGTQHISPMEGVASMVGVAIVNDILSTHGFSSMRVPFTAAQPHPRTLPASSSDLHDRLTAEPVRFLRIVPCPRGCHQYPYRAASFPAPGRPQVREFAYRPRLSRIAYSPEATIDKPRSKFNSCIEPGAHADQRRGIIHGPPAFISSAITNDMLAHSSFSPPPHLAALAPCAGVWAGTYGGHGIELLLVLYLDVRRQTGLETQLRAYKLTGDINVPRGAMSFRAAIVTKPHNAPRTTLEKRTVTVDGATVVLANTPEFAGDVGSGRTEPPAQPVAFDARAQVALVGFQRPSLIRADLVAINPEKFCVMWHSLQSVSTFVRVF